MAKRTSTYRWLTVLLGVVLLAAAATLGLIRPWELTGQEPVTAEPQPPPPPPPAVLPGLDPTAPAPTAAGLAAALDSLVTVGELGGQVSAAVVDVATGEPLYRHRGGSATIPASTTKLVTAATALVTLGPAQRLDTVAVAGAEPGEVVLVGGGDPTLAVDSDGFYPQAARLDHLASQVVTALGGQPVRRVSVDASRFTGPVHGPWDADIPTGGYVGPITALMTDGGRIDPDPSQGGGASPRWEDPDLAAGVAFAHLLAADPEQVERSSAPPPPSGATPGSSPAPTEWPAPGTELGRVSSPPVQRLVELMLEASDNVIAEVLARQVALARNQPASFDGASAAMREVLAELGLTVEGSQLADGSGLSRANQLTADLLTGLLQRAAVADPSDPLAGISTGLPVAGWSGTLTDRYRTDKEDSAPEPAAGSVRAKTGTLYGVHSLAGLVVTADGRVLAFAVLADQVPAGDEQARAALDAVAAALAECGCR